MRVASLTRALAVLLSAALYSSPAAADPATVATAVAQWAATYGSVASAVGWYAAYVVASVAWAVAISYATTALAGKKRPGSSASGVEGRDQMIQASDARREYVYGEIVKSGALAYYTSNVVGDARLHHLVIVLADHRSQEISDVYFGNRLITAAQIDGDGWVRQAGWIAKQSEHTNHNATVPSSGPYTVTVPGAAVVSVVNVFRINLYEDNEGGTQREFTLETSDYTRSGNVFTFGAALAGEDVQIVYVPTTTASPRIRIKKYLGAPGQAADADLIAASAGEWTSAMVGAGITYAIVTVVEDYDIFPNGIETCRFRMKGKLVFDPRTSTTAWSDNPALCIRDYCISTNAAATDVNDTQCIASANVCDEDVTINGSGGTQKRYRLNGMYRAGDDLRGVRDSMSSAMAGWTVFAQGKYQIIAGAYSTPIVNLSETDLAGQLQVNPGASKNQTINFVRGKFVSPADGWQLTDFTPVRNTTYETEDGGQLPHDITLEWTTDAIMSQRIAKITLERARQSMTLARPTNLRALDIMPGELFTETNTILGLSSKPFRVTRWAFDFERGIDLMGQEEAAAVYNWNFGEATVIDPSPNSNLPSTFPPSLSGFDFYAGSSELAANAVGDIKGRMRVVWDAITNPYVLADGKVEIQWQRLSHGEWSAPILCDPRSRHVYIDNVDMLAGYIVRGRTVNSLGQHGDWDYAAHSIIPTIEVPNDITFIKVTSPTAGTLKLEWTYPNPYIDHDGFEIRVKSMSGSGGPGHISGNWDQMTLVAAVGRDVRSHEFTAPANGHYCYAVRPYDLDGDFSEGLAVVPAWVVSGSINHSASSNKGSILQNLLPDPAIATGRAPDGSVEYHTLINVTSNAGDASASKIAEGQQLLNDTSGIEIKLPNAWLAGDKVLFVPNRAGTQQYANGNFLLTAGAWRARGEFASKNVFFQYSFGVTNVGAKAKISFYDSGGNSIAPDTTETAEATTPAGGQAIANYGTRFLTSSIPVSADHLLAYVVATAQGSGAKAIRIKRAILCAVETTHYIDEAMSWLPNSRLRSVQEDLSRAAPGSVIESSNNLKTQTWGVITYPAAHVLMQTKAMRSRSLPIVIDAEVDWSCSMTWGTTGWDNADVDFVVSRRTLGVRILSMEDVGDEGGPGTGYRIVDIIVDGEHRLEPGRFMEIVGHSGSNAQWGIENSALIDGQPYTGTGGYYRQVASDSTYNRVDVLAANKLRVRAYVGGASGTKFVPGNGGVVMSRQEIKRTRAISFVRPTASASGTYDVQTRDVSGATDDGTYILHAEWAANVAPSGWLFTLNASRRLLAANEERA